MRGCGCVWGGEGGGEALRSLRCTVAPVAPHLRICHVPPAWHFHASDPLLMLPAPSTVAPLLLLQVERAVWVPRAAVSAGPPAHRLLALAQGHQGLPGAVLGEEQLLLAPLLLAPLLAPRCVQTGAEGSGSWAARAGGSWAARAGGSVRAGRLRAFTTFTPAHIRPHPPPNPPPLSSPPPPYTDWVRAVHPDAP